MKRLLILFLSLVIGPKIMCSNLLIHEVIFQGNKEIPDTYLFSKIKSLKGTPFSIEKLAKDQNSLEKLEYVESLKVYPKVEEEQLKIIFEIVEKEDVKDLLKKDQLCSMSEMKKMGLVMVKEIEVVGNRRVPEEEIKSHIPLVEGARFSINKLNLGKINLQQSGLFLEVSSSFYKDEENNIYVSYVLEENPMVGNEILIEGVKLFNNDELMPLISQKKNSILNKKEIEKSLRKIMAKYMEAGYIGVEPRYGIDENENLVISINELVIDKISFQKKLLHPSLKDSNELLTKHYVLEREIEVKVGEMLKKNDLIKSVNNLRRLDSFKDVNYRVVPIWGEEGKRELIFDLKEKEQKTLLRLGGGLDGDYGFKLNLSGKNDNFRGKSQRLSVTFEMVFKESFEGKISFKDPWVKGTNGLMRGFEIYRKYSNYSKFELSENSYLDNNVFTGLLLEGGHTFKKDFKFLVKNNFRLVEFYEPNLEKFNKLKNLYFEQSDQNKSNTKHMESLLDRFLENRFSVEIIIDKTDNIFSPKNGFLSKINLTYVKRVTNLYDVISEGKGNKPDILSLNWSNKLYYQWSNSNVIACKLFGGVSHLLSKTDVSHEGFFKLGGRATVRGYSKDEQMGKKIVCFNFENRTALFDSEGLGLEMATFIDIGHAFDKNSIKELSNIDSYLKSYGITFRFKNYQMPLFWNIAKPYGKKLSTDWGVEFKF